MLQSACACACACALPVPVPVLVLIVLVRVLSVPQHMVCHLCWPVEAQSVPAMQDLQHVSHCLAQPHPKSTEHWQSLLHDDVHTGNVMFAEDTSQQTTMLHPSMYHAELKHIS